MYVWFSQLELSYLKPAHNPVVIAKVVFVVVSRFASVQAECVEPILKVIELTLQLLAIGLNKQSNTTSIWPLHTQTIQQIETNASLSSLESNVFKTSP